MMASKWEMSPRMRKTFMVAQAPLALVGEGGPKTLRGALSSAKLSLTSR